jgi:UDP-glucose 4-epimerase
LKALVTGGAGFIGHHLVHALVERGDEVRVLDDDLSSGRVARLDAILDRITFIEGSILEPLALDQAMNAVDVVFHEAALASVAKSIADPRVANEVNVKGTIELMRAASRHGVRRVVFAGSSAVTARQPGSRAQRNSGHRPRRPME